MVPRRIVAEQWQGARSAQCRQGQDFLEPQVWSVLSGVGDQDGRGRGRWTRCARLDSACGLTILTPPYTGIPEPKTRRWGPVQAPNEKRQHFLSCEYLGDHRRSAVGERGAGLEILPATHPGVGGGAGRCGTVRREPYVWVSSIVGPVNPQRFGEGGISWLTGTAAGCMWRHPISARRSSNTRREVGSETVSAGECKAGAGATAVRGKMYEIRIDNAGRRCG